MSDLKREAEAHLQTAVASAAAAFNLAGKREWHFSEEVREQALDLLAELKALFEESPFTAARKAAPRPAKLAIDLNNPNDAAYVRFKYQLMVQAKDGSFIGRRADPARRRR